MNILTASKISRSFGEKTILRDASLYLEEGEKVGIIGINGTGKSTLLKMIAGLEESDSGTITRASHLVISFLPQHPLFPEEQTVIEAVLQKCRESSRSGHTDQELETEAKRMLTRLGVTDFTAKCGILSGGQRKKLALVAALLTRPDLLILDEPTNHLDNDMAEWLEEELKKLPGALIMVTHDRYFLDSVATRIIEIDRGSIYSYDENYSGYLERKAEREEALAAGERKRKTILRKELEWVKRGARARSTKQKARLQRYEELKNRETLAAGSQIDIGSSATRLGRTTVEINHLSKAYGDKVLIRDFSYIFLKGDRVGFVGRNGCGKTTLVKLITGRVEPDEGSIVIGQTVKIGCYDQELTEKEMPPEQRVIDYIRDVAEFVQTEEGPVSAAKMLERFLFEGEAQYGLLKKLSGGEKRRLNLLRVLMDSPNVLILDESTNDLDIETLTILEDYLDSFPGIVIMVSHDRYFLDRCARRIFAFEEGGNIRQYEGGYTDYRDRVQMEREGFSEQTGSSENTGGAGKVKTESGKSWKLPSAKLKFSYKEQREYETIEDDIAALEEKIETLEAGILKAATDFVKLNELTKEKEETEKLLEEKMERWEYLEELAERIAEQ